MRRLILALALCLAAAPAFAARIKDISVLRSARDSQLVGYGLVVGLQGSGDTLRNAPFTEQSVQAMLTHLGLDVHGASLRNRNVASVIVTADVSAGVETGSRLDVTVSALGDAPSLMGGTLLLTQLQAADGTVYASAQGAVSVTSARARRCHKACRPRAGSRMAPSSSTSCRASPTNCARCSN
jgi:flagellar P-ring protein precursor FlgI